MYCGCPLPGDTIGQRLGRLVSKLAPPERISASSNPLLPPVHNCSAYDGTHPSDHNCIRIPVRFRSSSSYKQLDYYGRVPTYSTIRLQKMQARRRRDTEAVQEGKMDVDLYMRGEGHDPAFLVPVPFYVPIVPDKPDSDSDFELALDALCMGWNGGTAQCAGACAVVSGMFMRWMCYLFRDILLNLMYVQGAGACSGGSSGCGGSGGCGSCGGGCGGGGCGGGGCGGA